MNFPVSIHILGITVSMHGFCEALGIFIAFRYYLYLKRQQGDTINSVNRLWILCFATFGAVLGARIVGSLENPTELFTSPHPLQYFWGNKTILGGLLGATFAVEAIKKLVGEKQNSGDLFTYPLILGMIIGRIGCFSAGIYEETYGLPTRLPWGMNLGDGVLRHPVDLYEILYLAGSWWVIKSIDKRYNLEQGALFKIFMILYLVFRFLLDLIKPGARYFAGLGTIQITALLGLVYYTRYIIHPKLLLKTTYYAR